ncbi:MAG: hypothetical protein K1W21_16215 [Oscillospiraceae bacterium]|jgi:hypothetical protein
MIPVAPPDSGYVFAVADDSDFYIPGTLHVERDDTLFLFADDKEAAKAAELEGFPLIHGMEDVLDGVYLDTPENRETILRSLEEYPEYRAIDHAGQQAPGMNADLTL